MINRRPAFVVELADRHMQGPVVAAQMPQAIGGQIDGLADAQ